MLTREENEMLTRVGRGTPAGEMLRRYWMPVACAGELTDEKPIKAFRLLGEDLVVYRDRKRRYGVVGEQCPHRKASLAFGRVDEEGIRCPYHGWKFDCTGKCLEQPAEPASRAASKTRSNIRRIRWKNWADCSGPIWGRSRGRCCRAGMCWCGRTASAGSRSTKFITATGSSRWKTPWIRRISIGCTARRRTWSACVDHYEEEHNFMPFEYGIMKQRRHPGQKAWRRAAARSASTSCFRSRCAMCFARLKTDRWLRHNLQIRVPVDDAHTQVFVVYFTPNDTDHSPADGDTPWEYFPIRDEKGEYRLEHVLVQDAMAWETQGAPTDRTQEHLGVGDEGIILLRKLLREQIEIVQQRRRAVGRGARSEQESADRVRRDQRARRDFRQAAEGGVKSTGTGESLSSLRCSTVSLRHSGISQPKNLEP